MGWKERVKMYGSISIAILSMALLAGSMYHEARNGILKHFREKHGVTCKCYGQ